MPSGAYITVGYACYTPRLTNCHLDVTVYPLAEDIDQSEGLCGNYNGDKTDDLTPKGSNMVDNREEPVRFTRSYM